MHYSLTLMNQNIVQTFQFSIGVLLTSIFIKPIVARAALQTASYDRLTLKLRIFRISKDIKTATLV